MQKVRLLGICGSPRKKGNSWFLLGRALAAAKEAVPGAVETEPYSIAGKEIAPCTSCFRCAEIGDCVREDDFQELRDKWAAADAIIYSVPIYHMGIPGQLKCFIDRLGMTLDFYYEGIDVVYGLKKLKVVGVVVQGASIFAGQEQVMTTLINHAVLMGCVPVAGDLRQSYLGAAGWTREKRREDSLRLLYDEGEADAQVAVEAAESLGKRVVLMALVIISGGVICRDLLAKDGGYGPLLSRLGSADRIG